MHSQSVRQVLCGSAAWVLLGCGSPQDARSPIGDFGAALAAEPPVLPARAATAPLHSYDDAPRAVDSDDPAIWVSPERRGEALVITALKDAGLAVYDLEGELRQVVLPPNRKALTLEDPPAPGVQPEPGTSACAESESGETFGRFNNVDVQYGFELREGRGKKRRVDIAVVSDRGCDRLRIYEIDPGRHEPLVDITADDAPRVFPRRYVQPWDASERAHVEENPLDDQSTAYGITLAKRGRRDLTVFVTQRSRAVVAQLDLVATRDGRVSYERRRELRFPAHFGLRDARHARFDWTPCREDPGDDPQFEGLVVDQQNGVLYAAQEMVGLWKLRLSALHGAVVHVSASRLVEPVKSFGAAYWALPDDDEFSCEDEAPEELPAGTVTQAGNDAYRGAHLEADAEGLAIYYGDDEDEGYIIASSQGDDTFHVYAREGGLTRAHANRHLGAFMVEDAGETDGHDVVNVPAGASFPFGLFVLQNGKAPEPADTGDLNGYAYDGSTQFLLLGWEDVAAALGLEVETRGYDPRRP